MGQTSQVVDDSFDALLRECVQLGARHYLDEIAGYQGRPRDVVVRELEHRIRGDRVTPLSMATRDALTGCCADSAVGQPAGLRVFSGAMLVDDDYRHPGRHEPKSGSLLATILADAMCCGRLVVQRTSEWAYNMANTNRTSDDLTDVSNVRSLLKFAVVVCNVWLLREAANECCDTFVREQALVNEWFQQHETGPDVAHMFDLDPYLSAETAWSKTWHDLCSQLEAALKRVDEIV